MSSYTSRLGLRKPDPTDPESVITDVDNNLQLIDDKINANIFTSSTRPVTPHHGQTIYESDTHLLAIYLTGTGWVYIGGQAYARGKRAVITSDVDSSSTSTSEIGPFISVTFTAESGRRYWVETAFCVGFSSGSLTGCASHPKVRWASGTSVTTAGTQIGADILANVCFGQNSTQDFFQIYEFVPNINGNVTVGLFMLGVNSSASVFFDQASDRSALLFVRDVGM